MNHPSKPLPKRTWQASITPNPLLSSFKIIGQIAINIFNSLTKLVHNRFLLSHLKVIFHMLLSLSSYSLFEMLNIDFFNIYKINIISSRHYLFFLICFLLFFLYFVLHLINLLFSETSAIILSSSS